MGATDKTKKVILAATLTTALAFVGVQAATAVGPGTGKGPGVKGMGPGCAQMMQQMDAETLKARNAFLADSADLRKAIAQKRAEKRAVMASETPDPKKASTLAGELFDLREQMRTKAKAAGLPANMMMSRMGMMGMGNQPMMGNCGNCTKRMGGPLHHGGMM